MINIEYVSENSMRDAIETCIHLMDDVTIDIPTEEFEKHDFIYKVRHDSVGNMFIEPNLQVCKNKSVCMYVF